MIFPAAGALESPEGFESATGCLEAKMTASRNALP
jgi:hypothetical protein